LIDTKHDHGQTVINMIDWQTFFSLTWILMYMNNDNIKRKRKTSQKISLFFSIVCYVIAFFSAAFAIYWKIDNGTQSPIFASALASIFFFGSCGFLLQYIANVNLPDYNFSAKS